MIVQNYRNCIYLTVLLAPYRTSCAITMVVPQGLILDPLLFLVYINGNYNSCELINFSVYVDGTAQHIILTQNNLYLNNYIILLAYRLFSLCIFTENAIFDKKNTMNPLGSNFANGTVWYAIVFRVSAFQIFRQNMEIDNHPMLHSQ